MSSVNHALRALRKLIVDEHIPSVALPRLGGLDWSEVQPLIDQSARRHRRRDLRLSRINSTGKKAAESQALTSAVPDSGRHEHLAAHDDARGTQ